MEDRGVWFGLSYVNIKKTHKTNVYSTKHNEQIYYSHKKEKQKITMSVSRKRERKHKQPNKLQHKITRQNKSNYTTKMW